MKSPEKGGKAVARPNQSGRQERSTRENTGIYGKEIVRGKKKGARLPEEAGAASLSR